MELTYLIAHRSHKALGPRKFVEAKENVLIFSKLKREKEIESNLDYICIYTKAIIKYNF